MGRVHHFKIKRKLIRNSIRELSTKQMISLLNWLDYNYAGETNKEKVDNYLEQTKVNY